MFRRIAAPAIIALLTLAACGGGGGGGGSSLPPPGATPTPAPRGSAAIALQIVIPARFPSSVARSPRYVSPATQTVSIVVNGGAPQTFPVSAGVPCANSGTPPGAGQCQVFSVQAPIGLDTFVITLLDGSGNSLSAASIQQTIVQDQTNTISVNFTGTVVGLRIALSNAAPPTGSAAQIGVTLLPLDAAGFTVVGAVGALPTITVTDSDSSGATALYVAGSDHTCNTSAATPSSSVTVSPVVVLGFSSYPSVCLRYTGAALATPATISAMVAAGGTGSASATLTPAAPPAPKPAGAWVLGLVSGTTPTLEHVDVTLTPSNVISGSNTGLDLSTSLGLTSDAAGNAYLFEGPFNLPGTASFKIAAFAPTASGNVAPNSVTTFTLSLTFNAQFKGIALDGAGAAYVGVGTNQSTDPVCRIYRVPLTGGAVTATQAVDCSATFYDNGRANVNQLHADAQNRIYMLEHVTFPCCGVGPLGETVARFRINGDGTLTATTSISLADNHDYSDFSFDPAGNIVLAGDRIALYAAGDFLTGQNTTYNAPVTQWAGGGPIAVDASGNIFAGDGTPQAAMEAIPSGSSVATAHSSFVPVFFAPATAPAAGPGSSLSALPQVVETQSSSTFTVTETGYSGSFTETNDCGQIATISPASAPGPSATFTVTSKNRGGTCQVTVSDNVQHSVTVPVGITAINVTGQSRRRN